MNAIAELDSPRTPILKSGGPLARDSLFSLWTLVGFGAAIVAGLIAKTYRSKLLTKESEIARLREQLRNASELIGIAKEDLINANHNIKNIEFELTGMHSLVDEKAKLFPWLLAARLEMLDTFAMRTARHLETKKHPATKGAEEVRFYRSKARQAEELLHRIRYRQEYCEFLFPWISDLFDEDIAILLDATKQEGSQSHHSETDHDDPVLDYVAKAEYQTLSPAERNQRALERYITNRKSNWQIGRDFERYTGYRLEKEGFAVNYHGAVEGFDDLGRDLIAYKEEKTIIVQCKYWAKSKTIHEKHIYQLYGTFCDYVITHNLRPDSKQNELFSERDALKNITPMFITTTQLSERARKIASLLQIKVHESFPTDWKYPRVKCNVAKDGQKIYHLPFDQQYDRVKIEPERGEFYAVNCSKAEQRGFRRAWKWRPAADI